MARYAFSDLHGQLYLYQEIKKFVDPEDELYCLGDCGDRGPQSWETIKTVIEDPQVIYLKGNHEDMLIGAMAEHLNIYPIEKCYLEKYPKVDSMLDLLAWNGGYSTLQGWINDGADPSWITRLENLPTLATLTNNSYFIILSHAGYTPKKGVPIPEDYSLMWDRKHINDKWPKDVSDNFIIVHGHTPCPTMVEDWRPEAGAVFYNGGHKINIDVGSYRTNMTCLLDLDSFDEHLFFMDPDKNG